MFSVAWVGCVVLCLLVSCKDGKTDKATTEGSDATGEEQLDVKEVSYAMGNNIGRFLSQSHLEFDAKSFVEGVQDEMAGKSRLEPEQADQLVKEALMRQHAKEAAEQAVKGAAYLDSVSKLEGVQRDSSGLLYRVVEPGTGPLPSDTAVVEVLYVGKLIDGTEFDSHQEMPPARFMLQGLIPAWRIGIQKVAKGGKVELFVPPQLAYGEQGVQRIPGNATLYFEITLVDIVDRQEMMRQAAPASAQ